MSSYAVWFTEDAQEFLDRAGEHLAQDPVLGTVVATNARRIAAHGRGDLPHCWFAVVSAADGTVAGVAMRAHPQAPYPPYVLAMPDDAARALADALLARDEDLSGINGMRPAADVVAATVAAAQGTDLEAVLHMRLFELGALVEPRPVPGRLRPVQPTESELALLWIHRFFLDADAQAGRAPGSLHDPAHFTLDDVHRKIADGVLWFWVDDDDRPVHLTGANPPAYGVVRIGPVFTPESERGRGWASKAVAVVAQYFRAHGDRVILFTDQANPTSNAIYQALGFEPVVDTVDLVLH